MDSSPDLSPFLLDLDSNLNRKDSDLGRFVTKSTFNFHCAHLQCFVLRRMTFCQPVSYTETKISVNYLIFTAQLTYGLVWIQPFTLYWYFCYWCILQLETWDQPIRTHICGAIDEMSFPRYVVLAWYKVVLWSRGGGLTWRSQVGANPTPISTPLIWRYLGIK